MINLRNLVKATKILPFAKVLPKHHTTPVYSYSFFAKKKTPFNELAHQLNLGLTASKDNKLDESITYFQQVLQTFASYKDDSSLSKDETALLLRTHYELGRAYEKKEDLSKSLDSYLEALKLSNQGKATEATLEQGDINNSVGRVYLKKSQLEEQSAHNHFDKAKVIFTKLADSNKLPPEMLQNSYIKSMLSKTQTQQDKALDILEVLAKTQENINKNDPSLALIYNTMGNMYMSINMISQAFDYWEKGLEMITKSEGETSPKLITFYHAITQALLQQGRNEDAKDYLEKSIEICKKNFNEDHPKTAEAYLMSGLMYFREQDYNKALNSYEKGLKIFEKHPTECQEEVWMAYLTMAEIYIVQGRTERALEYFEKAEKGFIKTLGPWHPELAGYYLYWADLLKFKAKQYESANTYYLNALDAYLISGSIHEPRLIDIFHEIGPSVFEDKAYVYDFVGILYFQQNKYEESAVSFQNGVKARQEAEGSNDLDVYCQNLGLAFERRGLINKAVEFYQTAYELVNKSNKKEAVEEYRKLLINKLTRLDRLDEAKKL